MRPYPIHDYRTPKLITYPVTTTGSSIASPFLALVIRSGASDASLRFGEDDELDQLEQDLHKALADLELVREARKAKEVAA